jgi:hypothetical protein
MVSQSALGSNADLDPERITESRLKREDAAIIKPKIDEWSYRSLVLPNGLEALLVSDDKADMAVPIAKHSCINHMLQICSVVYLCMLARVCA